MHIVNKLLNSSDDLRLLFYYLIVFCYDLEQ
jgi:hypothetical protein